MKNHPELDCAHCVVSRHLSNQDSFCNRCCNRSDAKQFCIALHDAHHGLTPFVALNDGTQAGLYAERLESRGVSHILMRWDAKRKHFAEVEQQLVDSPPSAMKGHREPQAAIA